MNSVKITMSKKDKLIAYSIGALLITMTIVPLTLAIMTFDLEQWLTMIIYLGSAIGLCFIIMYVSRRGGCF